MYTEPQKKHQMYVMYKYVYLKMFVYMTGKFGESQFLENIITRVWEMILHLSDGGVTSIGKNCGFSSQYLLYLQCTRR